MSLLSLLGNGKTSKQTEFCSMMAQIQPSLIHTNCHVYGTTVKDSLNVRLCRVFMHNTVSKMSVN